MDAQEQAQFTSELLDVDIVGPHIVALEVLVCNGHTSYAITMTRLDAAPGDEYHTYYEYEVDLFDAVEHFRHAVSYVGMQPRH